jgi:AcrR family transcriptional regulator
VVDEKECRKYELRQRADAMAVTRQRIIDAAIELHGTVGPARTTIAGIAQVAGVQRHTVYRHFPTEEDLFGACSAHYWERHPWPDPATWAVIEPAEERLTKALADLYAFYAEVEPMLSNVLRDVETVPVVAGALEPYRSYLDDVTCVLVPAFLGERRRTPMADAAVSHATAFHTWQSLVRHNALCPADAVALMTTLISAALG